MKKAPKQSKKTAKKPPARRASPAARTTTPPRVPARTPAVAVKNSEKASANAELGVREQSQFFEKAVSLFHKRDFARAKEVFEKAAAGPVRAVAHSARIRVRICEQRTAGSRPSLSTAEDYYDYGVALLNRGDLGAAEKNLEQAARLAPHGDHVYYALALCFSIKGEIGKAYANLKRAIELQPRNRAQARNDPDFAEFLHQPLLEELLFPGRGHSA